MASPSSYASFDSIAKATGDLTLTIIPMIVGPMIAQLLYGIVAVALGRYFYVYGLRDHKVNLIAILLLCLLYPPVVVVATLQMVRWGWDGDMLLLMVQGKPLYKISNFLQIFPPAICQAVLIWRYWGLSGQRWLSIGLVTFVGAVSVYAIVVNWTYEDLPSWSIDPASYTTDQARALDYEEVAVVANVVLEGVIATLLTVTLWKRRSGFSTNTDSVVIRLIRVTVANSAIVFVLGVLEEAALHIHRERSALVSFFGCLSVPTYGICLLVNLLMRERLRADLAATVTFGLGEAKSLPTTRPSLADSRSLPPPAPPPLHRIDALRHNDLELGEKFGGAPSIRAASSVGEAM